MFIIIRMALIFTFRKKKERTQTVYNSKNVFYFFSKDLLAPKYSSGDLSWSIFSYCSVRRQLFDYESMDKNADGVPTSDYRLVLVLVRGWDGSKSDSAAYLWSRQLFWNHNTKMDLNWFISIIYDASRAACIRAFFQCAVSHSAEMWFAHASTWSTNRQLARSTLAKRSWTCIWSALDRHRPAGKSLVLQLRFREMRETFGRQHNIITGPGCSCLDFQIAETRLAGDSDISANMKESASAKIYSKREETNKPAQLIN